MNLIKIWKNNNSNEIKKFIKDTNVIVLTNVL